MQFYRTACLALCESGDFDKFKSIYEEERVCFSGGISDNSGLLAVCLLHDVQSIFTFLLQRSTLADLGALHEAYKVPLLLHASIVLHRNTMFQELYSFGLGIDNPYVVVKCCHIAIQSCNWLLLETLLRDSHCDLGPESVSADLLFSAANSLHAPSVLLLLQAIRSRHSADYVKHCINMVTPKGLTILNVLMLLVRICERDPTTACNTNPLSHQLLSYAQSF